MIIGIFGDSFAEGIDGHISWAKRLETVHSFDVKNYAHYGTSIFWSYQKLLMAINKIDTIIFVLTDYRRLYHSDERYVHVSTLFMSQHQLKNSDLTEEERIIYKAAEQYHIHLSEPEFDKFVQDQIVKEIKTLAREHDKKLIIVPAYPDSLEHQKIFKMSLFDITKRELFTNFGDDTYRFEKDQSRANHMSKENNEILSAKISEILAGKIDTISLDDFVFTKYNEPGLHWVIK